MFGLAPLEYFIIIALCWYFSGIRLALQVLVGLCFVTWIHIIALQRGILFLRSLVGLLRLVSIIFSPKSKILDELQQLRQTISIKLDELAQKYRYKNTILKDAKRRTGLALSEADTYI